MNGIAIQTNKISSRKLFYNDLTLYKKNNASFMFQNILVVCMGNICRSPTAERILQKKLPNHRISSASINTLTGKTNCETSASAMSVTDSSEARL